MLSKTCEYAIRALLFIAQKTQEGNKTGIKEIAKGIDSPEHFIAKILQDLGRKGYVLSLKGPTGGFYHDSKSLNHSLADIVREVDGDKLFTGCALGLKQCSESHPCPIHHDFKKIRTEMQRMLQKTSLGDLADGLDNRLTYLKR